MVAELVVRWLAVVRLVLAELVVRRLALVLAAELVLRRLALVGLVLVRFVGRLALVRVVVELVQLVRLVVARLRRRQLASLAASPAGCLTPCHGVTPALGCAEKNVHIASVATRSLLSLPLNEPMLSPPGH